MKESQNEIPELQKDYEETVKHGRNQEKSIKKSQEEFLIEFQLLFLAESLTESQEKSLKILQKGSMEESRKDSEK